MLKLYVVVSALFAMATLAACSNNGTSSTDGSTESSAEAQSAKAEAPPEPNHPQPTFVTPPKPKPGAPHGPGFDMPLIELAGYAPSRPMEVLRDAHMFAGDHPEVASYVPCYCGCGSAGHKHNADCFVKGRDPEGRVTEWEPHGVACAVCIDIAVDSMKMRNSGASVTAIRNKIRNEYRPHFPNSETPTAAPPVGK
jgi:Protein of unknown function with PCYCGC motif